MSPTMHAVLADASIRPPGGAGGSVRRGGGAGRWGRPAADRRGRSVELPATDLVAVQTRLPEVPMHER